MSFHLTHKAKADLIDIAHYTHERWGYAQRNTYLKQIDDAFHSLDAMPKIGCSCDDIRAGYRKYRVAKHLIFYRSTGPDHIEIVRVLHGSMDIENQMAEDDHPQ